MEAVAEDAYQIMKNLRPGHKAWELHLLHAKTSVSYPTHQHKSVSRHRLTNESIMCHFVRVVTYFSVNESDDSHFCVCMLHIFIFFISQDFFKAHHCPAFVLIWVWYSCGINTFTSTTPKSQWYYMWKRLLFYVHANVEHYTSLRWVRI